MERLAVKTALPTNIQLIANQLLDSEGLCTCGRVIGKFAPKFVLMNLVPSQGMAVIGAYCQPCSIMINAALKRCRRIVYDPKTITEPVDFTKKLKEG